MFPALKKIQCEEIEKPESPGLFFLCAFLALRMCDPRCTKNAIVALFYPMYYMLSHSDTQDVDCCELPLDKSDVKNCESSIEYPVYTMHIRRIYPESGLEILKVGFLDT